MPIRILIGGNGPARTASNGHHAMKKILWIMIAIFATVGFTAFILTKSSAPSELVEVKAFDADRAYQDVLAQMEFGPRTPGSDAHDQTIQYIRQELIEAGWSVELQELTYQDHPIQNIIARRGSGSPLIVLGAHYDSRMAADRDPDQDKRVLPVPGANDGASGVAVLLELSRTIPKEIQGQIWLSFFDAEDQGNLPGWDWILGSRAFLTQLEQRPDAVVIVDMIGDSDLAVYQEKNSNPALSAEIWQTADDLSYAEFFIPMEKYSILDDHTPFLEIGIPAVDLIDFDYPYYHTTEDTADKVSADSLKVVGEILLEWLSSKVDVGKN